MSVSSFVHRGCIKLALDANSRDEAIRELVEMACADGLTNDPEAVIAHIIERDTQRPTVVYDGFALPRSSSVPVTRPFFAIGRFRSPTVWCSSCPFPVSMVVLFCYPGHTDAVYFRFLVEIAKVMKYEECREALLDASTDEELMCVVEAILSD